MAVNFNPGGIYQPKPLDFSELANIPNRFWRGQEEGRERKMRAELAALPKGPDGQPDMKAAVGILLKYDPKLGVNSALAVSAQDATDAYRRESLKSEDQRAYEWAYPPNHSSPNSTSVPGVAPVAPGGVDEPMRLGPDGAPTPQDFIKSRFIGKNLTPAQKSVDEQFGKDYASWIGGGGYSGIEKTQGQLKAGVEALGKSDSISGPFVGLLDKAANAGGFLGGVASGAQSYFVPESRNVRQQIEEAIQTNLRLVLGSQYTEKEGENLLARTYDPMLSEEINARRAQRVLDELDRRAKAKDDAARYYEKNGTLSGWQGTLLTNQNQIEIGDSSKNQGRLEQEPYDAELAGPPTSPAPAGASVGDGSFVNTEKQIPGQAPPGGPDIRWKSVRNPQGLPPTQEQIDALKQHANNPKAITIFDAIFNKGSADFILRAPGR
jgi:hypothetical protein